MVIFMENPNPKDRIKEIPIPKPQEANQPAGVDLRNEIKKGRERPGHENHHGNVRSTPRK